MTARPDPDVAIAAWLKDEAPARAPERLLTASRDRIRSTHQRRAWWPVRRTRPMSRTTLAAAMVVAVVALGGAFLVIERDQREVAGPSPTPSADPSPSLPGVVPPSRRPRATAPTPSAFPRRQASGSPRARWARPATTPRRCGSSTAGSSLWAAARRSERRDRGVVRPGQRDLVRHREHGQAPRRGFRATLLSDGKVLVGEDVEPGRTLANGILGAEVYDPARGTWTVTGKMVTVVREGIPTLLRDGRVLVVTLASRAARERRAIRPRHGDLDRHREHDDTGPRRRRGRPAARWQGARAGRGIYPRMLDTAEIYDPIRAPGPSPPA